MGREWDRASAVTGAAPLASPPIGAAALLYFHLTCDSPAPASESGHQELQGFGGRYSGAGGREAAVREALAGSPDL